MFVRCLRPSSRGSSSRGSSRLRQVCGDAAGAAPGEPSQRSRLRDRRGEPVFQYVGQNRKPSHKVFVWGFSFTGALGIPSFVVPDSGRKRPRQYQLTPYRLETAAQITSAGCGYGFTLLSSSSTDASKLWGMGLNRDSQLGFQRSQHNRFFSLGNNAYGQCGRPIVEDEVYSGSHIIHKIRGFSGRVVQVACGQDHSLFLTDGGRVYSCGWGADGQTGLGHHHTCSSPVELKGALSGVQVQQVSTYADCSLALSRDGQVYGWGNSEYGQLAMATDQAQVSSPRRLPLAGCGRVVQVACGGSQVAVLNDQGEVFVWGYGILGKGPHLSESRVPEQIPPSLFGRSEFNPSVAVSKIRCGLSHFAAITGDSARAGGGCSVWG